MPGLGRGGMFPGDGRGPPRPASPGRAAGGRRATGRGPALGGAPPCGAHPPGLLGGAPRGALATGRGAGLTPKGLFPAAGRAPRQAAQCGAAPHSVARLRRDAAGPGRVARPGPEPGWGGTLRRRVGRAARDPAAEAAGCWRTGGPGPARARIARLPEGGAGVRRRGARPARLGRVEAEPDRAAVGAAGCVGRRARRTGNRGHAAGAQRPAAPRPGGVAPVPGPPRPPAPASEQQPSAGPVRADRRAA